MSIRTIVSHVVWITVLASMLAPGSVLCGAEPQADPAARLADRILRATGTRGGLVVHLGAGDGKLTAALWAGRSYLVQGLDADPANVDRARRHVESLGRYGRVAVDVLDGKRLPFVDNLVNLVVAEDLRDVPLDEVVRVLCPEGVALVLEKRDRGPGAGAQDSQAQGERIEIGGRTWTRIVKPRPAEIDEWTHYLHDASNNAVAHDDVVAPPRRMQWVGGPRYARHHDRMSSVSAVVSGGGRVFTIFDEATPFSILSPPKWTLIARDAFNGVVLWKRRIGTWFTHLWPLKSGPAQLPRRLVTDGKRVYVTLGLDAPLVALHAATGETVHTFEGTQATEEVILSDGTLFVLVNDDAEKEDYDGHIRFAKGYRAKFWDEAPRKIKAIDADSGRLLWTSERRVLPGTLAADKNRVVFHDGQSVVCLKRDSGEEAWRSDPVARSEEIQSFYVPILVLYDDLVLFSGGESAGKQTGSWYEEGEDTLTALDAETGKRLWSAYHPPSGYRSPEDLLVADGLVWTGETTSGRAVGMFAGRDPRTGEVKCEFPPDVETYWFHHRCYRGKATDNYLLTSRTGVEFIDVRTHHWTPHHWFRGACLYGVMPANGLIYAPQHPCACYLESKLYGFNALAPATDDASASRDPNAGHPRLQRGPAFGQERIHPSSFPIPPSEDWPTFRHDPARSGRASTTVPTELKRAWQTDLGGRLTSPVVAEGKVFVASVDRHAVCALDAGSGERLWQFTAGGRVDSPPTVYRGLVLFGSADGHVYALRAADGALAWRFRGAPANRRLVAFGQIESVWPIPGSVLVDDGVLYCVAGRSMFLDGGLRFLRLDPMTGRLLSETTMDERDPGSDKDLQSYVSWLNMPTALPDVLSSDGRLIYMRSQPFDRQGKRLPLEAMPSGSDADRGAPPATQRPEHAHLFSPTGFLDDTWWHRTYWMYGSTFVSGWCGYYLAGKAAPAGRILVFDDEKVYGYGRKPQYYRWTTPIEHQLFAADKLAPPLPEKEEERPTGSRVRVAKSASLNPAGKPVTVMAWVKAEKPGGVILARGGGAHGYVLYLSGGRPRFAVRVASERAVVAAKEKVAGRWAHLAGVLTAENELQVYVDGKLAASAEAPGPLAANPAEAMEIGADEGSGVGDYQAPFGLTGTIDEVRVYHRALAPAQIEKHAASTNPGAADDPDLVLAYTFDRKDAADASGRENHGTVEGAVPVKGRLGQAMKFAGAPARVSGFAVVHHWTQDVPLFARAMVLADGTLFFAGPVDLVDEPEVFRQINDPEAQETLAEQATALEGKQGDLLWAVSAADGEKLSEHPLDASPVFDGLAAAGGRLYVSTVRGAVQCFAGR